MEISRRETRGVPNRGETSPRTWSTNRRDSCPTQRQVYDLSLTVPLWGRMRIIHLREVLAKHKSVFVGTVADVLMPYPFNTTYV